MSYDEEKKKEKTLTEGQRKCLDFFATEERWTTSIMFGSSVLTSLVKRGLLDRSFGIPWNGASRQTIWRITEAGRVAAMEEKKS